MAGVGCTLRRRLLFLRIPNPPSGRQDRINFAAYILNAAFLKYGKLVEAVSAAANMQREKGGAGDSSDVVGAVPMVA